MPATTHQGTKPITPPTASPNSPSHTSMPLGYVTTFPTHARHAPPQVIPGQQLHLQLTAVSARCATAAFELKLSAHHTDVYGKLRLGGASLILSSVAHTWG